MEVLQIRRQYGRRRASCLSALIVIAAGYGNFILRLREDSHKQHAMDIFSTDISANITRLTTAILPIMIGMICHEIAHGWAAWRLGDPTARALGRLTMNPRVHLDLTGSLLFLITALTSNFIIGWAKPVPVNPRRFASPRLGMALVSLAGPLTNFLLAFLFALAYAMLLKAALADILEVSATTTFILKTCAMGISINVTLAWFNLLPIPPLDGSHITAALLPLPLARAYFSIGRYGIIIAIVLLGSGLLSQIMRPLVRETVRVLAVAAGIPSL